MHGSFPRGTQGERRAATWGPRYADQTPLQIELSLRKIARHVYFSLFPTLQGKQTYGLFVYVISLCLRFVFCQDVCQLVGFYGMERRD